MNFGQGMPSSQLDPNIRKQVDDYLQQRVGAQSLSQGPSGAAASLSQPFSSGATSGPMPSPMTAMTPPASSPMARSFATGGMVKSGKSRGDGCITKGGTKGRVV